LVAELAATLVRWSGDAVLRAELGAAARARAETMFREERMVGQTKALIDAVLLTFEKPMPLAATA
jgi:glycosyltransferase involved in cell wall biosynthesis